jgi:hypothetical protein
MHETVLTTKRGGARRFARIDIALALLRTLRGRGPGALGRHRAAPAPLPPRQGPRRPLLDALEVGETWDAHDAERAFNFERHWAALVAQAPRGLRAQLLNLKRQARDSSPTFARLNYSMGPPCDH